MSRSQSNRIGSGRTQEKSRAALGGGKVQGPPGLTIDQIVVPRRTQAYTPNGVSLYAGWLLLRANFVELRTRELRRIRLPRTWVNRGCPPWLSDDVSTGPLLEQLLPLLKQGSRRHPQGLGQQHRVGLARHVGSATALHLPDEPPWHAGPLREELRDAPALAHDTNLAPPGEPYLEGVRPKFLELAVLE